jgi:hypothetical protein
MEERPKVPIANIVVGDIIYWVCIIATILSMVGPVVSILLPDNNVANPYYIFSLVWEGKKANEVWAAVTQDRKFPGVNFWINHLSKGDGITQLGVWFGCFCTLPAVFFGGLVFLFRKDVTYVIICWWIAFMVLFSMLGILQLAE